MNAAVRWIELMFEGIPLPLLEVWGRLVYYIGFGLMLLAFGGFTLRPGGRWGLGRERQAWDTKAFLSIPLTFVLIITTGFIGSAIVLVPGAQTFESLKDLTVFLCVVLFGYPALVTVPFAYGLSDLIEGTPPAFLLGWLPGYFINPTCFWIAYQLFGKNPDFRRARTWAAYAGFVVLFMAIEPVMWGHICSGKFTTEISYRTITPALFFTTAITWIIAPLAMLGALPLARRCGMFWAEIAGHVKERYWRRPEWLWESGAAGARPADGGDSTVPIRMLLLTPFIALMLLMVGATAYITLRSAEADANKLAVRLHEEIAENINLYLDDQIAAGGGGRGEAIAELLRKLPIALNGRAFVVDRAGRVVASSAPAGDPVVAAAIVGLAAGRDNLRAIPAAQPFRFVYVTAKPLARDTWLARATAYQDRGGGHADWLVVTAMPEAYYLAGLRAGNSRSAVIFALALLLALAVAAALASLVTAPLRRISNATRALAEGGLPQPLPGSSLTELNVLAHSFNRMVEIRRQAEMQIRRLNRTYEMLSEINQLLVRKADPAEVQERACQIAVDRGGFLLAWIGLFDPAAGQLRIVAHGGADEETARVLHAFYCTQQLGCTFTARALGTGRAAVCNDIAGDPRSVAWRDLALSRGYRSLVSLPLVEADATVGTFNLYAGELAFFDDEEVRLLTELAGNISFGRSMGRREAERVAAEVALRASEERFRELAETIDDVFWVRDPAQGRHLYVSPAYERIWGRSSASLTDGSGSWLDGVHPDDLEKIRRNSALLPQIEGRYDEEFRIVRPDGSIRWIRARAFPVRTRSGGLARIVGVARDITDQRSLEEQLHQSQKLEALGQLAGGVAHDFNNILAAIMMQADLLRIESPPGPVADGVATITLCADRAANLTRQMLLFSRKQVMQPRALDLNESVSRLMQLLNRMIGENVRVELNLSPEAVTTWADEGMIDQVLMNLALNARDAMPGGGLLLIETDLKTIDAQLGHLDPDAKPGRYAWLSVSDTGSGMAPEVLARVFEPFFTTKGPGKGTGLGLATVFGVVKQHRGWIRVYSEPGRGTNFQIFLPATAAARTASHPPMAKGDIVVGHETILLAEDDDNVRRMTRTVLELRGYRVIEAADGDKALVTGRAQRAEIQLLLTDLIMPGSIGGQELARRLRAENPALRIIYTSGYSREIAGKELELFDGENFLQKPCPAAQLLRCVRESLDA
ncbi:MAG: PAS domain-containing protein [Verrucomicrobia bacterium]|nr:PAS domain-containing protein [Verrucomicrobiota bacterium]